MLALRDLAKRHNLVIIEDACEAIGAEFHQRRVGSFGDLAVFGFYPNKQITTGEGGAVLAHTQFHAERLRSLRNQGRVPNPSTPDETPLNSDWLHHPDIGFNYRLSDIACALGRVQLTRIDEILDLRRSAAEHYHSLLADIPALELPPLTLPGLTISWFVFVIRLPETSDRAHIQTLLAQHGVTTATYFQPIHRQPAWRQLLVSPPHLPVTESIGSRTLALPFFTRITPAQQEQVASVLGKCLTLKG